MAESACCLFSLFYKVISSRSEKAHIHLPIDTSLVQSGQKRWFKTAGASFTKQGKLVRARNYKTGPKGGEIYVGDLLTMSKIKNTGITSHLHIDQRNIPNAAQISIVTNKEIKKP